MRSPSAFQIRFRIAQTLLPADFVEQSNEQSDEKVDAYGMHDALGSLDGHSMHRR